MSTEASSSQNPTDVLKTATFSRTDGSAPIEQASTSSDLLMAAYDPAKLHPLADLGDKLDYLLLDDDKTSELPGADTAIPSRGWSDDLCYGTGTMYLSGKLNLFEITLFESGSRKASFSPSTSLTLSQRFGRPIFRPLIVLICHMLTPPFNRFGPWRCMGSARRCSKASCRVKYQTADQ